MFFLRVVPENVPAEQVNECQKATRSTKKRANGKPENANFLIENDKNNLIYLIFCL